MTCCLYRHFDKEGALLYVGISLNAVVRLSQHRDGSHWYNEIASVKVEQFQDRKTALEAERIAITSENPRHNLKRPTIKEVKAAAIVADSRADLVRRIVQFNPLYSMQAAADALGLSVGHIKSLMDKGELGFIEVGTRRRITGWQLIEFLEYATQHQKPATHKFTHKQGADNGGRSRTMAEGCGTQAIDA